MSANERFLLDTSALLALRGDEPGADRVAEVLASARAGSHEVLVSFMSRMEILYRVESLSGSEAARHAVWLLDAMAIRWIGCEPAILAEAARIKAGGRLSVADAWIAATAVVHQATLVHRDPELRRVSVAQEMLPSRRSAAGA